MSSASHSIYDASFCVEKLLQFALNTVLRFALLHFAAIVTTFCRFTFKLRLPHLLTSHRSSLVQIRVSLCESVSFILLSLGSGLNGVFVQHQIDLRFSRESFDVTTDEHCVQNHLHRQDHVNQPLILFPTGSTTIRKDCSTEE